MRPVDDVCVDMTFSQKGQKRCEAAAQAEERYARAIPTSALALQPSDPIKASGVVSPRASIARRPR